MNESTMQAVLMHYALTDLNHIYVIPNSVHIYYWEADLITVTKSMFVHEFEIKVDKADYKRDCKKSRHNYTGHESSPNYNWYATCGFDIEPPEKWGWVSIEYYPLHFKYEVIVKNQLRACILQN